MFYTEDDVQPAFLLAEATLGPNGRMELGRDRFAYDSSGFKLQDVAVMTDAFGKIWYGDLPNMEVVQLLSNRLGVTCKVIPASGYGNVISSFNPQDILAS